MDFDPPPIIVQRPCPETESIIGVVLGYARIIGIVLCAVAMLWGVYQLAGQYWRWRTYQGHQLPSPGNLLLAGALGILLMTVGPAVIGAFSEPVVLVEEIDPAKCAAAPAPRPGGPSDSAS